MNPQFAENLFLLVLFLIVCACFFVAGALLSDWLQKKYPPKGEIMRHYHFCMIFVDPTAACTCGGVPEEPQFDFEQEVRHQNRQYRHRDVEQQLDERDRVREMKRH